MVGTESTRKSNELEFADSIDLTPLFLRVLGRFIVTVISTLTVTWLVLEFILGHIFEKEPLAGTGLTGTVVVVLGCAFLSSLVAFAYLFLELRVWRRMLLPAPTEDQPEDKQLADTLIAELESAYQGEEWEEVLKIGSVLSRPLWVTGKYRLRVRLGKLVEDAAAYSNHPNQQAGALIDDLGWTLFVLEQADEAKKNIQHGIRIAEQCGNFYLAYKGYRHLSGIAMQSGSLDEAIAYHERSGELAQRIQDEAVKKEVVAGIHVNNALLDIKQESWGNALQELQTAQEMYRELGDKDREVKLYHFIGDVFHKKDNLGLAKDTYREGLSAAKEQSRKDGILKNNIGLANVAIQEGDLVEAKLAFLRAAEAARELGRGTLAEELEANASRTPPRPIDIKF